MFGPLKRALRERRFATEGKDKDAVQMWLWSKLRTFFAGGIRRLVNAMLIRVEENRN